MSTILRNKWRLLAGVLLTLSVIVSLLGFGQTTVQAAGSVLTVDLSGTWLAGINVELWSSDGATKLWTQYNQQGAVRTYNVAPGTYDVKLVQGPKVLVIDNLDCSNDNSAGDVTSELTVDLSGTWLAGINVELYKDDGGIIWTAYNQQGAVRVYNVLKNTYDLKLRQGPKVLDVANLNCNNDCNAGDVTSVLTVDLSGTWLAGINVELYVDDGGIIWTAYNQQGAIRTYNVLKNTYDLKLRQGMKVKDVANLDCNNDNSAGDVTAALTINLNGLGVCNIELHLNDGLVGSVGPLIWTAYNQSGTPVYNVLKNHYDVKIAKGSDTHIYDNVNCTGDTCTLALGGNQPPVLAPIGNKTVGEGQLLSFTISASDPDGNPLTYTATNLPDFASFDTGSRTFSWTPRYDQAGSYPNVHFEVSDASLTDSEDITITVVNVNQPPVANAGPDQAVEQSSYAGAEVTLDGSGSSDPDGDPLTYLWTWDGSSASGVNPTATFPLGSTTVTLTVSDGELSANDTVEINVVDTTPPEVTIGSPENSKTYLNTQGPIPVQYTATDICDSSLTITMTLDGNPFTGDKINLCGMASGEHTLVVSAADDSGNTGTDSATFNVVPQSLKTFTIRHMLIQWARPGKRSSLDKDTFTLSGRLQLPAGCTVENLNESATLTIAISDASGTDTVLCKVRPLNKAGIIWKYNGKEQPPGEGMNIHNLIIWWTPQSGKWAGWAGFHISGVLQLPEEIGVNTQPAEATVTIEMPAKTESGCGSLIAKNTVKFKVLKSARLWLYNMWPNLPNFPCDPTGTE